MTELTAPAGLHKPFADWREAALADGWLEKPGGVWGTQARPHVRDEVFGQYVNTGERKEGDRTILLKRGEFIVWLIDRDLRNGLREIKTHAWAKNGHQKLSTVPEVYSSEEFNVLLGECLYCGSTGDPSRLKRISFAGVVCPDCDTSELRAKLEPEGWYN